MSKTSKIEWTDAVWEPVGGCRHASDGCRNCYAETLVGNLSGVTPSRFRPIPRRYDGIVQLRSGRARFTGDVAFWPDKLVQPLSWRKPRTVFVCSQSDLFYEERPFEAVAAVYGVMAATPHIKYLVLTKRPGRRREFVSWIRREAETSRCCVGGMLLHYLQLAVDTEMLPTRSCSVLPYVHEWHWPNIGEGVSIEDQETADERIPVLLDTPAAMPFVSYEPALGPVDFRDFLPNETGVSAYRRTTDGHVDVADALLEHSDFRVTTPTPWAPLGGLSWVIAGSESGPGARPAEPDWFRSVRDQCASSGTPFFLKQYGVNGGRVEKGCPALDGKVHDARPAWLTGGAS